MAAEKDQEEFESDSGRNPRLTDGGQALLKAVGNALAVRFKGRFVYPCSSERHQG